MSTCPLKLIETTGGEALAKWQELKSAGEGWPVILGDGYEPESFESVLAPLDPDAAIIPRPPSIEETLRAAAGIRFPDDLARRKAAYSEAALRYFEGDLAENPNMPPIGEWPASPNPPMGLSVVRDILTGKPLPKVHIALAPTDDWTTIPAYLRWGGWNDCPAPEFHVAAMRTWRDRYGAELVGLNADTINLRVATKPATRKEALALARDHYIYCTDVIDQGVQTYSAHAADLMANDWWFFWWD